MEQWPRNSRKLEGQGAKVSRRQRGPRRPETARNALYELSLGVERVQQGIRVQLVRGRKEHDFIVLHQRKHGETDEGGVEDIFFSPQLAPLSVPWPWLVETGVRRAAPARTRSAHLRRRCSQGTMEQGRKVGRGVNLSDARAPALDLSHPHPPFPPTHHVVVLCRSLEAAVHQRLVEVEDQRWALVGAVPRRQAQLKVLAPKQIWRRHQKVFAAESERHAPAVRRGRAARTRLRRARNEAPAPRILHWVGHLVHVEKVVVVQQVDLSHLLLRRCGLRHRRLAVNKKEKRE